MKQIHLKGSWIIPAPREEIYKIVSDFESYPKHFKTVAHSLNIVERQGNTLTIEVGVKSFGSVFPVTMKTTLIPSLGFISDNANHRFRASGHEEFLMEEIPEGTRVNYSYEYDISRSSFLLRLIAKPLLGWFSMWYWRRAFIDKITKMLVES